MKLNPHELEEFIHKVEKDLLPSLRLESVQPEDPIMVNGLPEGWSLLGKGNFAAVLTHPQFDRLAVKVYAGGRPGLEEEIEVYRRLGSHPAFSECYHSSSSYLILKKLQGVTFYDCLQRGIRIPRQVIQDVDQALVYAARRGLYPRDVHGKNVMIVDGHGCVVDVSDFLSQGYDPMWEDLKRAYRRYYWPFLHVPPPPIPGFIMNWARKGYRFFRKDKLEEPK